MKHQLLLLLICLKNSFTHCQNDKVHFHLQTYESMMNDQYEEVKIEEYLTKHWTQFILSEGNKNYYNKTLLDTDLLLFQNHNLFSKGCMKNFNDDYEHSFEVIGDSIQFWFGFMNMLDKLTIKNDSSTFILFPTRKNHPITVITQFQPSKFLYTYYYPVGYNFVIKTLVKSVNEFKYPLGIRNKKNLMVLLFRGVES